MGVPKRKPWVCFEQECEVCKSRGICDSVPDDCQFAILHGLDMREPGLQERPRRSGKTHDLAELAAKFVDMGAKVVVVCLSQEMGKHFERVMWTKFEKRCDIETKYTFGKRAGRREKFFVLTDELLPEEVSALHLTERGHELVLGYYTAR
jgi:hypothetical protein